MFKTRSGKWDVDLIIKILFTICLLCGVVCALTAIFASVIIVPIALLGGTAIVAYLLVIMWSL
jgi:hypothetical protein